MLILSEYNPLYSFSFLLNLQFSHREKNKKFMEDILNKETNSSKEMSIW